MSNKICLKNVAIIAHVDHGKTTLVDKLLSQADALSSKNRSQVRIMDSNELEKERGITILAKNTALKWKDYQINIVDTPGHADFGGEVERILSMVDAVLLVVDAVDGPMPQTRFVTQKAFARNLRPLVVVNKIDRAGANPELVVEQVFDLFDNLGASNEQLDFQVVYASALEGYATLDWQKPGGDMVPLLDAILQHVPDPAVVGDGPLQMQISTLDYSSYLGVIGIGRLNRGSIAIGDNVTVISKDGSLRDGKITKLFGHLGVERVPLEKANAGDIIAVAGLSDALTISDTICARTTVEALPPLIVDEPTISMFFQVNDSPLAGRVGKFVTSRHLRERLYREALHNIALKVEDTASAEKFKVSGRGELHLGILIETMRREGYELAVSQPQVVLRETASGVEEPYEYLLLDVDINHQGPLMQALGERRGQLKELHPDSSGRVRLEYIIPSRGLLGFHHEFQTITSGTGIASHLFDHYGPYVAEMRKMRSKGVLIANCAGTATAYALWNLQARGSLFIGPKTEVYEGMIVGLHSRDNDLIVNVTKEKQLTNIRAAGSDENIILTPPLQFSPETALGLINHDELIEFTPETFRFRKIYLKEHERKREERSS
jgi:GTP-binding protein